MVLLTIGAGHADRFLACAMFTVIRVANALSFIDDLASRPGALRSDGPETSSIAVMARSTRRRDVKRRRFDLARGGRQAPSSSTARRRLSSCHDLQFGFEVRRAHDPLPGDGSLASLDHSRAKWSSRRECLFRADYSLREPFPLGACKVRLHWPCSQALQSYARAPRSTRDQRLISILRRRRSVRSIYVHRCCVGGDAHSGGS